MDKPAATCCQLDNIALYKCWVIKYLFAQKDQQKIWHIKA